MKIKNRFGMLVVEDVDGIPADYTSERGWYSIRNGIIYMPFSYRELRKRYSETHAACDFRKEHGMSERKWIAHYFANCAIEDARMEKLGMEQWDKYRRGEIPYPYWEGQLEQSKRA